MIDAMFGAVEMFTDGVVQFVYGCHQLANAVIGACYVVWKVLGF
jgi:hypothetical protein